eukprot:5588228-Pleurochrysis_carterae.AAC.2
MKVPSAQCQPVRRATTPGPAAPPCPSAIAPASLVWVQRRVLPLDPKDPRGWGFSSSPPQPCLPFGVSCPVGAAPV